MDGSLGLKPPSLASGATVPRRVVILEVLYEDGTLPEDVVYVGRGHHSHRVSTSDWKCPWVPGHDCSWDEWIPRFVQCVPRSGLNERLPELMGKRLACDCSFEEVCGADILAGLVRSVSSSRPHSQHDPTSAKTRSSAGMGRFARSGCQSGAARGSGELLLGPLS